MGKFARMLQQIIVEVRAEKPRIIVVSRTKQIQDEFVRPKVLKALRAHGLLWEEAPDMSILTHANTLIIFYSLDVLQTSFNLDPNLEAKLVR